MQETKFFREDDVDEMLKAEAKKNARWIKLHDQLDENCRETLSRLRLMLVFLFKNLGDSPEDIEEKYIKNLKDETATETARLALKISQGEI